jgi:hypothetical protein
MTYRLLLAASLVTVSTFQCGTGQAPALAPYPGSVKLCQEHVVGAPSKDGKPGAHINWISYYSIDAQERIVAHYIKVLGTSNHRRETGEDIWRFPLDKPENVLTVAGPKDERPTGNCGPPPRSARAIIIISQMTRPD